MILNEGGNVFPDVTPFDHANVPEILSKLQRTISDTGIRLIPVGSAATPKPGKKSGDMDVIADEEQVLGFFNAKDAKSARRALNDYISTKGFQTAQSGINVHVRVPVGSEAHQVDIMVTPKAEKVSRFHTHDIPDKSPYKGVNKQLMMAILAKQKGYMWSAWQGLFDRTAEGKKGDFISDDLDEIAQRLLGDGASSKNLGSVEAILRSLPEEEAQRLLAKAEEDPNWQPKKQEKVDEGPQHWFREIAAKLAEADTVQTGSGGTVTSGSGAPVTTGTGTSPKPGAVPTVDPKNYQVPSIDFLKKNYEHPADVIYGGTKSETDPERVGAWEPTSDFGELMLAWNAQYYRARQANPDHVEPKVPNDWELIRRLLSTPEGKEWAVEHWVGLSNVNDKSPEAEFQRAQQKEFEKQRNARELAQKSDVIKPGWKFDPELGTTPAYHRSKQQAAAPATVKEQLDAMLRIARLK